MNIREWLSRNIIWVLIALITFNLLIVYWGTVNLGIYGTHNSIFGWDLLRRKKLLLQEQTQASDAEGLANPGQRSNAVSSPNLRLVCSDDDLASAFASVRPAVVNITADRVTQKRGGSLASSIAFDDPSIRFIEEESLGSGIIVDRRGFIVTNAHVVSKAQNIKVVIFGFERKVYVAEIVWKDLLNDIAILKIHPEEPLPTAILGDSDMIKVADRVLAIGSPFGLEQTVTAGIISDNSRNLVIESQTYEDMIQTDAAINRGNSGGALVNIKGEVIGINTAIYAPTGVFAGVGFAIPINRVKPIVKETLTR
ncbi:MAG: trypsin-like peptidase domain-containing protein [Desulfobacteraceae bacterium]|nr:trypsin-like peptidase domain-containing protein [Desulfobacteraceae bacterium]